MPMAFGKLNILGTYQMGVWVARKTMLFLFLTGCAHVVSQHPGESLGAPTVSPEPQLLLEVDYHSLTNAVILMENIIERRCLWSVMIDRLMELLDETPADTLNLAHLSEDCLKNEVDMWTRHILLTDPEDILFVLNSDFDWVTGNIENWIAGQWRPYDYYVKILRDDDRYRFLTRTFTYKAKLYSILSEKFSEDARE